MISPFVTSYDFGDVRVAPFALLTFTALLGSRSCGVVIAKFSGPRRHLAKFADGLWRRLDAWVHLDPHLIWQATESYVERGDAFGLVAHECSLLIQA
jgi:hypothetical protein